MPEMSGGDAVYHALRAMGVEYVFGIPSVHNIPIYDAILRHGGITPIGVRHEQGAVHAADAYARVTGKLGVAITSTGPGAANAVPGLYEAGFASSRVLMITGQIESAFYGEGRGFLHEAENQLPMLRSITRRAESVRRTEDVADTMLRVALDINTGRPQPGAVEIPIDLQFASANVAIPQVDVYPRVKPDEGAVAKAIVALQQAKRPLIWAGGGVLIADAAAELMRLAEMLHAPVITSISGRGAIPEDHPLCLGPLTDFAAMHGTVAEADVMLAVGTRFQDRLTRRWTLPVPSNLIHLDADPAVIGLNYPAAVSIVGDARLGLQAILDGLGGGGQADEAFVVRAQAARDEVRQSIRQKMGPDFEAIMDSMRALLPRDAMVVRDVTIAATLWANRILPILASRTSINPVSTAIGPGLSLALGAAVGSGKKTLLITGDGGFMLSVGELAAVAQHNLPLVMCVFNDKGYGVLRLIQSRTFEGRQIGVDLHTPDFVALSRAVGIPGETVGSAAEFHDAFQRAVAANGPVLLDIDVTRLHPMTWP